MNFRNQARELIDADTVMRDIAANNLRNQTGVNLFRRALLFHSFHSQRLIWGQYSRERSGYNFQQENIWNGGVDPIKPDTQRVGKGCTPGVSDSPAGNGDARCYSPPSSYR